MTAPIALDEARRLLLDGQLTLGEKRIELGQAAGRVLAEDLIAGRDQPPHAMSAMDGYAVRGADVIEGATLAVIGEAPAGAPFDGRIGPGECVRIATGGVVPEGANRIVIQEHVERDGASIAIRDARGPAYIRPAGMDFAAGEVVLARGALLGAAQLGLAAALGQSMLRVARRPRVAILSSGDELVEPGGVAARGKTFDSASYALAALIERWGATAIRVAALPDNLEKSVSRIGMLKDEIDLFVPLGGASVGERDVLRPAFERLGATLLFAGVAVLPGKPSWHARFTDGRSVVGLPGNPSSAFVCAHLFLKPLLFALTGRDPATRLSAAKLAGDLSANGPRESYLRASTHIDDDGQVWASVDPRQDSGLQTPLATANALVRRFPGAVAACVGDRVDYLPI